MPVALMESVMSEFRFTGFQIQDLWQPSLISLVMLQEPRGTGGFLLTRGYLSQPDRVVPSSSNSYSRTWDLYFLFFRSQKCSGILPVPQFIITLNH